MARAKSTKRSSMSAVVGDGECVPKQPHDSLPSAMPVAAKTAKAVKSATADPHAMRGQRFTRSRTATATSTGTAATCSQPVGPEAESRSTETGPVAISWSLNPAATRSRIAVGMRTES
jgi:hypothetical protein